MQITYKICKVKYLYDKVLKKVTYKLQKVSRKIAKSIKNYMKSTKILENLPQ